MELIDHTRERYMGAVMSMHMLYSILYLVTSSAVLYSLREAMTIVVFVGAFTVAGFLLILSNGIFTPVFQNISTKFVDYIITPLEFKFSSYRDYPRSIEISRHIRKLHNDSGETQVLYTHHQLNSDGDLVIDFISGNLSNQFTISINNLAASDYSNLSCVHAEKSSTCFSCEQEKSVYRIRTSDTMRYIDDATYSLCEDCIERIIKTTVKEMDEESYDEIVASNL